MAAMMPAIMRWAQLASLILDEFRADGRSPVGILQGDFSARELRILTTDGDEGSGVGRVFTEQELATVDLKATAKALYRAWKVVEDSGIGR